MTPIDLPSATETVTALTAYSNDVFTWLFPVAGIVLGFIVGVLVINKVISTVGKAARRVVGKGRRG